MGKFQEKYKILLYFVKQNKSEVKHMKLEELDQLLEKAQQLRDVMTDLEQMESVDKKFIPVSLDDKLLTVAEAAKRLSTSESMVYDLMNKGLLPYLEIGRRKIRESTLVQFIAEYEGYSLNGEEPVKIQKGA